MSERNFIVNGFRTAVNLSEQPLGSVIFQKLKNLELKKLEIIEARSGIILKQEELLIEITKFAISLKKFGVKKGELVTIISENCYKTIITTISLLLLGVKVEYLNPDYTIHEIRHLLKISPPTLVCCSLKSLKNVDILKEDFHYDTICFDKCDTDPSVFFYDDFLVDVNENEIDNFSPIDVEMEEVAMLFSSSGTTGLPKAVELSYSGFNNNLLSWSDPDLVDMNSNDSLVLYLPFFHIFGQLILLSSIIHGCKIVIMDKFHPEEFFRLIETYRANKLFAVPPILTFLTRTQLIETYDVSSIKDIICGGAPLKKEIEEVVAKRLNVSLVRQIYGLTEATGAVTVTPKHCKKSGTVGKAATGFQIKICDLVTDKILGPNEIGELRITTDGLMKGYCNNHEATRAAFDDDGWFRTGDLGYYDDDAYFYVVDRVKEMIKYKGFQVAPAELENLLLSHPAVKDVGVIGIPDERAIEVPLAFIVKQSKYNVESDELIKYVAENLSIQKHLYGGVRFVDNIPKTASGKILRRKLKELL